MAVSNLECPSHPGMVFHEDQRACDLCGATLAALVPPIKHKAGIWQWLNRAILLSSLGVVAFSFMLAASYVAASPEYRLAWGAESQSDILTGRQPKTNKAVVRFLAAAVLAAVSGGISVKTRDRELLNWLQGD